jgi:hypothetical protein
VAASNHGLFAILITVSILAACAAKAPVNMSETGSRFNDVLPHSQSLTSLKLFEGSAKALKTDLFSASLQFYAAEIRAYTDNACFPPMETGGNSPLVLLGALREEIGEEVNPKLTRQPALYAQVVERLQGWDPSTVAGYDPGWKYKSACNNYAQLAESYKTRLVKPIKELAMLLQIPEYKRAFDIVQDFNMAPYADQQKPDRIKQARAAEDIIMKIEKDKDVNVLTSGILKDRGN